MAYVVRNKKKQLLEIYKKIKSTTENTDCFCSGKTGDVEKG